MNWSPQPRLSRADPWDAESLEREWPHIHWREALPVKVGEQQGLLCRICAANQGFQAKRIGELPKTPEAFEQHMREEHP